MKIEIEHLGYFIEVKDLKSLKIDIPHMGKPTGCSEIVDSNNSIIYLELPIKLEYVPTMFHEIIHVLRNILMHRGMDIAEESEHMAYLAQFIARKIMKLENK